MRTSILAALIFFSLAPLALAQTGGATGSWTVDTAAQPVGSGTSGSTGACRPTAANDYCIGQSNVVGSGSSINPPPGGNPAANPPPGGNPGSGTSLINPLKGVDCSRGNGDCLSAFLLNILDFVIYIGSIVIILMIVFVGFKFVTARGNAGEIEEAKKMLLWTVIGALVLLGSKAIALGIQATVQALGG